MTLSMSIGLCQWQKFRVSFFSYIFPNFVHVHVNGEGFGCPTLLIVLYSSGLCPCQCIYDHGHRSIRSFIFVHVSQCLWLRAWQCSAYFFSFFNFQFYCNTHGVLILHIQQVKCLLFM